MPWIAREAGLFKKYDIDFNLVFIPSSPVATAATLSGDAEIGVTGAVGNVRAIVQGSNDLVFIGDVKVGEARKAGEQAGVVESVKAASDIYAPVNGDIIAFNETLDAAPETLNSAPYDNWIFKMKPANVADVNTLMDAAGYEASVAD